MKLSFTTLGCPDWTWERIVDEASRLGYDGVELRGIAGELRLGRCEALREERLEASLAYARERRIAICCLDTSCAFHDEERFDEAIEEGMETIDLAVRMGVASIRVFGDSIADNSRAQETVARVARGLQTLGEYAEGKDIQVLLETHGDFSSSDRVSEVLRQTSSPAIGVIWDIHHTFKYGGHESPAETWRRLGDDIRHAHIKDALGARPVLLGEGELPLPEWIALLREVGYDGWLSFEWEKRWHPEIEEPEVALPAFIDYVRRYL
ncbi:sugar phosphate isomerase/epimerase [Cohnella ginsengisoli]|uniref:Sugar phosphate isomerase/epimerase n=1 Tax=Cohnella ginsengisoli TaxID=425004 RepID=A0A9X4KFY2_9BACL|nr:sugar phosphate isomerase/epimerase family protein [Cohnella ginsengisoli]MDG0791261.1 sugar phosphate isomerase/epimerase [Cohnella ginsengisoli]